MVQVNAWEEGARVKELLIELVGAPLGTIVSQLIFAAQYTVYLSLIAFVGGGIVAVFVTLARIAPYRPVQSVATGYIWLFQSTPLLMLLFLCGLGFPHLFQFQISPWTAASVALTIFTSAYLAEVWRGAIGAVGTGQWEASNALNLRYVVMLRRIIIPQAVKFGLAPTIGFLVQIIKGTSLAYIIGFHDLMLIGKRWANAPVDGSEPFVVYPIMAVLYFCLCYPLALFARQLEQKALARGQ